MTTKPVTTRLGLKTVAVSSTAASLPLPVPPRFYVEQRLGLKIKTAWCRWKSALEARRANNRSGELYLRTSYRPRRVKQAAGYVFSKSQRLGMINLTPIDGSGPTLSRYYAIDQASKLGEGSSARVFEGPRGYVLRTSLRRGPLPPAQVNPSQYADLRSFLTLSNLSPSQQVCRDGGLDLFAHFKAGGNELRLEHFEQASADLKALHQRGLFHMDIKLENMACKIIDGKTRISFIDCDTVTTADHCRCAPTTYPRSKLIPGIKPKGRADDEYGFLLVLLSIVDFRFLWIYSNLADAVSEKERVAMSWHAVFFAHTWVKPDYRLAVAKFIIEPSDENTLAIPLHDAIDWLAEPKKRS